MEENREFSMRSVILGNIQFYVWHSIKAFFIVFTTCLVLLTFPQLFSINVI